MGRAWRRVMCWLRGGHDARRLRFAADGTVVRILPGKTCRRCGAVVRS